MVVNKNVVIVLCVCDECKYFIAVLNCKGCGIARVCV